MPAPITPLRLLHRLHDVSPEAAVEALFDLNLFEGYAQPGYDSQGSYLTVTHSLGAYLMNDPHLALAEEAFVWMEGVLEGLDVGSPPWLMGVHPHTSALRLALEGGHVGVVHRLLQSPGLRVAAPHSLHKVLNHTPSHESGLQQAVRQAVEWLKTATTAPYEQLACLDAVMTALQDVHSTPITPATQDDLWLSMFVWGCTHAPVVAQEILSDRPERISPRGLFDGVARAVEAGHLPLAQYVVDVCLKCPDMPINYESQLLSRWAKHWDGVRAAHQAMVAYPTTRAIDDDRAAATTPLGKQTLALWETYTSQGATLGAIVGALMPTVQTHTALMQAHGHASDKGPQRNVATMGRHAGLLGAAWQAQAQALAPVPHASELISLMECTDTAYALERIQRIPSDTDLSFLQGNVLRRFQHWLNDKTWSPRALNPAALDSINWHVVHAFEQQGWLVPSLDIMKWMSRDREKPSSKLWKVSGREDEWQRLLMRTQSRSLEAVLPTAAPERKRPRM